MKHFGDLSPAGKLILLGALASQYPELQQLAAQEQRREVLAERLAFVYRVTIDDVLYTASTYPWVFETFYAEALAGRVEMKQRPAQGKSLHA